jgi:hypothetical protein
MTAFMALSPTAQSQNLREASLTGSGRPPPAGVRRSPEPEASAGIVSLAAGTITSSAADYRKPRRMISGGRVGARTLEGWNGRAAILAYGPPAQAANAVVGRFVEEG